MRKRRKTFVTKRSAHMSFFEAGGIGRFVRICMFYIYMMRALYNVQKTDRICRNLGVFMAIFRNREQRPTIMSKDEFKFSFVMAPILDQNFEIYWLNLSKDFVEKQTGRKLKLPKFGIFSQIWHNL